jgi:hypothetical protein
MTRWVRGKMVANLWAQRGRFSRGKKVPLKTNIGVTNKKTGKLNISMVRTIPVKNRPMDPKAMPPRNAKGMIRNPSGYWTRPNRLMTPCISHHGVKGLLIIHHHKRGIGVLKKSVLHDVDGDQGWGDKRHVRHVRAMIVDRSHQDAQSNPKGQQIENWLKDRWKENHLPDLLVDGQVALPDPNEPF